MRCKPGWTWGPCWGEHCTAQVLWPPSNVTAPVECTSLYPHRGVVEASRYPKKGATK